jgi:hypothetical protein
MPTPTTARTVDLLRDVDMCEAPWGEKSNDHIEVRIPRKIVRDRAAVRRGPTDFLSGTS